VDIYKQVQAGYDRIVLEYAKRNHSKIADNLIVLAQDFIQRIGQNSHILEVGCGTGRDMAWFESQGVTVTGVDLSISMLQYARKYVQGNLFSMNMCNLALPSSYFDGAWCCASLLHLPKIHAALALQEIHRALKRDGMLILSIQEGNGEEWEESYLPGVKRFFARYQSEEMKNILHKNGFIVTKTISSHENLRNWLSFTCIAN
jgi:ubiquinone/menaquinone biosynthesis C-methylase UbiE